jgi:hypothetical protein
MWTCPRRGAPPLRLDMYVSWGRRSLPLSLANKWPGPVSSLSVEIHEGVVACETSQKDQSTLRLNTLGSIYTGTRVCATGVHLEICWIAVQPSGRSLVWVLPGHTLFESWRQMISSSTSWASNAVDRSKECSDSRWDLSVTCHAMIDAYAFFKFSLSNSDVDETFTCTIHKRAQRARVSCDKCRIILLPYVIFKMLFVRPWASVHMNSCLVNPAKLSTLHQVWPRQTLQCRGSRSPYRHDLII